MTKSAKFCIGAFVRLDFLRWKSRWSYVGERHAPSLGYLHHIQSSATDQKIYWSTASLLDVSSTNAIVDIQRKSYIAQSTVVVSTVCCFRSSLSFAPSCRRLAAIILVFNLIWRAILLMRGIWYLAVWVAKRNIDTSALFFFLRSLLSIRLSCEYILYCVIRQKMGANANGSFFQFFHDPSYLTFCLHTPYPFPSLQISEQYNRSTHK